MAETPSNPDPTPPDPADGRQPAPPGSDGAGGGAGAGAVAAASGEARAGAYADAGGGTETATPERTWTVLIAALGGEGGGVLSSWLVDAASSDGRRVQATSVPGVAQRTGATTYYLEIGSRRGDGAGAGAGPSGHDRPADAPPADAPAGDGPMRVPGSAPGGDGGGDVMALLPTPGNVDLLVASELLEAGRAAQNGMITPGRTTVIASTHRMFAIAEKSAMGDGRFNDERVRRAVRELSRRHVLTDLGKVAEQAGTVLSSVLLGAIAGSGALPISRERLRSAIERAGIAVEANWRGFDAGCRLFDDPPAAGSDPEPHPDPAAAIAGQTEPPPDRGAAGETRLAPPLVALAARADALPDPVRAIARLGTERAADYQDARYAGLYLDRLEGLLARVGRQAAAAGEPPGPIPSVAGPLEAGAPNRANGGHGRLPRDGGQVTGAAVVGEVARELALWMCFEDLIRVADLKTRRSRIERVRAEVRAKPGQPVAITEFLKPGVDEWCSVLPGWLARPILRAADRGGWRRRLNVGLHVRTSSVSGFLLLWTLARLKWLRRGMHRYREEQARIESWLGHVGEAHATSPALALEVARCANLVKGYGDTHERGVRNFERTMGCLGACAAASDPAARLRALREAALADPEGESLDSAIAALKGGPSPETD